MRPMMMVGHGLKSTIERLDDHPRVEFAFADALAHARPVRRDLPIEAEGEFAACSTMRTRRQPEPTLSEALSH